MRRRTTTSTSTSEYLLKDARRRTPLATWNSNNVYPKGALVLWMLQKQLGREPFWAAMNRYLTSHAYGNATSDDLRQAVLEATGQSLPWFWSQWIYQAGYPEFSVASRYDTAASALVLTVRQTQRDTATADSSGVRFSVPQAFRAPIAIRVGTAAGDVVARVTIDRREQVVRIEGVRSAPTMVSFDDENAVVKTLDFPQPTEWLATLLQRHPDLWQRSWAIDQLAVSRRRSPWPPARWPARRVEADYDATRARAAGRACGASRPSWRCRRWRGPRRTPPRGCGKRRWRRCRRSEGSGPRSWRGGPGWATRATRCAPRRSAPWLGSIPRERAPRCGKASGRPSYRDVIQSAAISAVVDRPDSGLVADVEAIAGQQPLAAYGLAALAARGDGAARAALARLLEDRRGWVREWAREATGME